jgi:hypothetical protein
MKLPRVTVRRLMIAVAVVGLIAGSLIERGRRFREMADRHWKLWLENPASVVDSRAPDEAQARQSEHHRAMGEKYRYAARYPWLPVAPDTPEPD